MPELDFKGKEFVRNHHLTVPFRPLEPQPEKSVGEPDLDGNLIIHGDNLEALKALLPKYAGKVDCIFIDPPYNTGNEGWCYNDNVNSPLLRAWFSENPVGVDDGLRHDKWCCMMWPRLKLLHDLLHEAGFLAMTIDSNEVANVVCTLDEIFGESNRIAQVIWRKVDSPNDNKVALTPDHDYLLLYAKDRSLVVLRKKADDSILASYRFPEDGGAPFRDRLLKKNGKNSLRRDRPTMFYPLTAPDGTIVYPEHDNGEEARWSAGEASVKVHEEEGTLVWKQRRRGKGLIWEPYIREYAPAEGFRPFPTIWSDLDTMRQAKAMLRAFFGTADVFDTPKPIELIAEVFALVQVPDNALILDSFAGSGTTAHAVLKMNAQDGGNRKFILVECEDYADTLTAERVRRVINGYPFQGTQRETLYEKKLTWTEVKKGDKLVQDAEGQRKFAEQSGDWDKVGIKVEDGVLKVIGERKVEETAPGLGGTFTYCTLGEPLRLRALLEGERLPSREALGDWLLYVSGASSQAEPAPDMGEDLQRLFLSKRGGICYWLIYKPDLEVLRTAALTLDLARAISATDRNVEHRVFGPQKFVGNKLLRAENLRIEFAQIPYALFRVGAE